MLVVSTRCNSHQIVGVVDMVGSGSDTPPHIVNKYSLIWNCSSVRYFAYGALRLGAVSPNRIAPCYFACIITAPHCTVGLSKTIIRTPFYHTSPHRTIQ